VRRLLLVVRLRWPSLFDFAKSIVDGFKINLKGRRGACSGQSFLPESTPLAKVVSVIIKICTLRTRDSWSPNPRTATLDRTNERKHQTILYTLNTKRSHCKVQAMKFPLEEGKEGYQTRPSCRYIRCSWEWGGRTGHQNGRGKSMGTTILKLTWDFNKKFKTGPTRVKGGKTSVLGEANGLGKWVDPAGLWSKNGAKRWSGRLWQSTRR